MKKIIQGSILAVSMFALVGSVSAHVTLSPKEAVVGYTTFTVNVPTEKEIPTVAVRVVVPEGAEVHGVAPVPGWTHAEKKAQEEVPLGEKHEDDEDGHGKVTEITWSGGSIANGEFMQFPISVSYAGDPKQLVWKAYQTYSDGSVVAWDDTNEKNPAPKVSMVKTSKLDALAAEVEGMKKTGGMQAPWLSVGAFLLSVIALVIGLKGKMM